MFNEIVWFHFCLNKTSFAISKLLLWQEINRKADDLNHNQLCDILYKIFNLFITISFFELPFSRNENHDSFTTQFGIIQKIFASNCIIRIYDVIICFAYFALKWTTH